MTRYPLRFEDLLVDRVLEALAPDDAAELEAMLAASADPLSDASRSEALEEELALAAIAGCVTGGSSLGRPPSDGPATRSRATWSA